MRYLEYFPGVIFLTTNQEAEIDEAVSSRAISIRFDALNAANRTKIWRNHLFKESSNLTEEAIDSICKELGSKYELDGREVKKLAQLSLNISRWRKKAISIDTVKKIYDLTDSSSGSPAAT